MFNFPVLIGDIGGTNGRFWLLTDAHSEPALFDSARLEDHDNLLETIQISVLDKTANWPKTMILAVAAPLSGRDTFRLTNINREIDPARFIDYFKLDELVLMNDFAAQALASVALKEEDMTQVGNAQFSQIDENGPKVVLGPGTGLGIANVICTQKSWVIVPGEGGHIDLGPRTKKEFEIWEKLEKFDGRISAEDIVCGKGLTTLYRAIAKNSAPRGEGQASHNIEISEAWIVESALSKSDPLALETCNLFLSLLGRIAGDLALLTLARGGVYIGGGVAPRMIELFSADNFRKSMDDKAPCEDILSSIPSMVITHNNAALYGLTSYAQTPELYIMDQAVRIFKSTDFSA